MLIFKIIFLGIVASGLTVLLRNYRPELAVLVATAAGALLILGMTDEIKALVTLSDSLAQNYGLDTKYVSVALRVVGIACVGELGVQICKDCGESAIASKVELCGKIVIIAVTVPVLNDLLKMATGLLK